MAVQLCIANGCGNGTLFSSVASVGVEIIQLVALLDVGYVRALHDVEYSFVVVVWKKCTVEVEEMFHIA